MSQFDSSRTGDASGKMAGCRERLQTSLAEKSDGHPQFRLRSRQPELVSGAASMRTSPAQRGPLRPAGFMTPAGAKERSSG